MRVSPLLPLDDVLEIHEWELERCGGTVWNPFRPEEFRMANVVT